MPAPCSNPHLSVPEFPGFLPSDWTEGGCYVPASQGTVPELEKKAPAVQSYASPSLETSPYSPPDSAASPTVESSTKCASGEAKEPQTKCKVRTCFSQEQLAALNQRFQVQRYLSPLQIQEMAASLNLNCKQVKTWFQNRRMKYKRYQKDSLWMQKAYFVPQARSPPKTYMEISSHLPQTYPVYHGGNVQRVAGHPYPNYAAGGQNPHQTVVPEERAIRHPAERLPQNRPHQQTVGMYQNYSAVESVCAKQAEGYNAAPPLHYPSSTLYHPYNYQQLPYNCQPGRTYIKSEMAQDL